MTAGREIVSVTGVTLIVRARAINDIFLTPEKFIVSNASSLSEEYGLRESGLQKGSTAMWKKVKSFLRGRPSKPVMIVRTRKCAINSCPQYGFLRKWSPHTYIILCDDHNRLYADSRLSIWRD